MPKLFKNKYRIDSIRAQWWDYSNNANYFITIVLKNRIHHFGEIFKNSKLELNEMKLSEIGEKAYEFWYEIPQHFPFVKLDAFIVMPDHIHGIVIIDKPSTHQKHYADLSKNPTTDHKINRKMAAISPKPGSLSVIIGSYKSVITKNARKINPNFQWLPRFHDYIIRNENEFFRIKKYIDNNIDNWKS